MTLSLAKFDISIKPKELIVLPRENKGNILRGGFGHTFKNMICVKNFDFKCKECEFLNNCPYPTVFESSPPSNSEILSKNADIPRPFVIKAPITKKTEYTNQDTIKFSLVLVNKVIKLLPYFITTFKELGIQGINKPNKGKFDILSIKTNEKDIYNDGVLQNYSEYLTFDKKEKVSYIKLEFLTETTLKDKGIIIQNPNFSSLIKRLRDRISSLALFYGDGWNIDFKQLGLDAEKVIKTEDNTYWNEKSRFSKRKGVKHDMSGFIGEVAFEGDITPFMEILEIGQYIHVGKGAVFGNGWYRIVEFR
ncbi:MAG: CRISPR system precrRNA processing endoribonuclease RAMP protein Cas6 [Candidatus Sericytochromatia bacterium]